LAAIDALPPLREVIAAHGIDARKALGQNFLLDLNLTSRIARSAGPLEGRRVVEIGPGPGGLTRALLAAGAAEVVAIERDARCLPALEDIAAHYPGRLRVIEGDALEHPLESLAGEQPLRVVANLPYNVGTLLLTQWLTVPRWPPAFESLTLMFQREVADRIVATPAKASDYGRLGVLCGWRTEARILFDVAASAFTPPPKVTSSVVHLIPRPAPEPCELKRLEQVTAAAFGQRRKMLRQSLKSLGDSARLLAIAEIDATRRPETLSVSEFVRLANALQQTAR
jgi:16S rRNA (adenine1518-N6/adenine1519-N6)-dimethyltransferase